MSSRAVRWGTVGRWIVALVAGAVLAACGEGGHGEARGSAAASETGATARNAKTARAVTPVAPTGTMIAAESLAVARDVWNKAEVIRRLTEAGVVVMDSGQAAERAGVHVPGNLLHVGRGELEIYVYDNTAARRHDTAAIDTAMHGLPTLDRPRYIMSGNLIAVLRTPDDRLAERVENTLMARHNSGTS
jgi:hypothetical protein